MMTEADFCLGSLMVRPISNEIVTQSSVEVLEPRVMLVLVELARRRGEVVTRDALVEHCWSGRIVSEDAIQRCVAKLRRLGEAHGGFFIDTIWRVGYRLSETVATRDAFAPETVDPFAHELYQRGRELGVSFGAPGAMRRAIALLEEAVIRAPQLASAWTLLAQARVQYRAREAPPGEVELLRIAIVDSVQRALALDPEDGGALACLAFVEAPAGAFENQERILRRAMTAANSSGVLAPLSSFCASVGRNREALELADAAWRRDPMHAGIANWRAILLRQNGMGAESNAAIERILEAGGLAGSMLGHAALLAAYDGDWKFVDFLLCGPGTGAVERGMRSALAAIAVLRNPTVAQCGSVLAKVQRDPADTVGLGVLCLLACLGFVDEAYACAEGCSFQEMASPSARLRSADVGLHALFSRAARDLRRDRRFVRLCSRLGLVDYWMKTGRWPDCASDAAPHYDFIAECESALPRGTASDGPAYLLLCPSSTFSTVPVTASEADDTR